MTFGLDTRRLVPERLDALPADDPAALRSRADLRRINALMANATIMGGLVRSHAPGGVRRVADIGCGDGTEALRVLGRLGPVREGANLALVDIRPAVGDATRSALSRLGWKTQIVEGDIFDWLDTPSAPRDLITANLFLHHFEGAALARLMQLCAARSRLFVATEPLRTPLSLAGSRLVALIGANAVTRHDAPASVRAGFAGAELGAIWPGRTLFEGRRLPFTHAFAGEGNAHA